MYCDITTVTTIYLKQAGAKNSYSTLRKQNNAQRLPIQCIRSERF